MFFFKSICAQSFIQIALLAHQDARRGSNPYKPLLNKQMHYLKTQSFNGTNIVNPAQIFLKISKILSAPINLDFLLYRSLGSLTEEINSRFRLYRNLLQKSPQKNPDFEKNIVFLC